MEICNYESIITNNINEIIDLVGVDLSKGGKGIVYMDKYTGEFKVGQDNPSKDFIEVCAFEKCIDCDNLYNCDINWSPNILAECIVGKLNKVFGEN